MADVLRDARTPCAEAAPSPPPVTDAASDVLRAVRLFHASIEDAVDRAVAAILTDIAAEVTGRELRIAPFDLRGIVANAVSRYCERPPVRVRVHPDDVFECALPIEADDSLRRGDAAIDLRDGWIDASLGVRLSGVLAVLQP